MQICFMTKRKKEHWHIYGQKPTSLQSNGMAAIPKTKWSQVNESTHHTEEQWGSEYQTCLVFVF